MSFTNLSSPVIFGCSGLRLTPEERDFFKASNPHGFILCNRNMGGKSQLKALIEDLQAMTSSGTPSILVDQGGGSVNPSTKPSWYQSLSSSLFGKDKFEIPKKNIYESYARIAEDLMEIGVTVYCGPLLDLSLPDDQQAVGDNRTFGSDPMIVADLAAVAIKALQDGGITPIMKYIPGQGAATSDREDKPPIINLSFSELQVHFYPFKKNVDCPWAMTSHAVYTAIDPYHPANQSFTIIHEIIRREIGFQGFLISGDIGMTSLSGSFRERTKVSLEAGCDAVLHGSGKMEEMIDVMKGMDRFYD